MRIRMPDTTETFETSGLRKRGWMGGGRVVGVAIFLIVGVSAAAQTVPQVLSTAEPDLGVLERERPAYDPKGIPLDGFRLFPVLDITGSYDDNVFRLPWTASDWFMTFSPAVAVQSEWGRHFLSVSARADAYKYMDLDSQDLTDWEVKGSGRYDISHAATLSASASHGEYHELWSSPDSQYGQTKPNRFYQTHVTTALSYQPSSLGVSVAGMFDRYDWDDNPLPNGNLLVNSDRNEDKLEGYVRAFYEFSPGYAAFVRATYNEHRFDLTRDRTGINRASHGYRYDGGMTLVVSHLVRGEFYLGYLKQDFAANPSQPLTDVAGFDYGVQFDWFATPVLTVHLGGNRQLADTTFAGISVEDAKRADLSADYEILRNLIATVRTSLIATKYTGSPLSDTTYGAGSRLEYLVNRYAAVHIDYGYERRTSDRALADYTDNTISIGLTLHV
jgi:hypothetical protein